jgi:YhgE/Pip-like protein
MKGKTMSDLDVTDGAPTAQQARTSALEVVLGRHVWRAPLVIGSLFVALVVTIYLGSVVNPTGHLHGLPVLLVDQDTGANAGSRHLDVGADVASALQRTPAISGRLALRRVSLGEAHRLMDEGKAYATVVLPATLSSSVLLAAGAEGQNSAPAQATIALEENQRLGSLGVNLAAGVLTPALTKISEQLGTEISPSASASTRKNPVLTAHLADPVSLRTITYRPLPDHSALGLSAFYIALLSILAGFIAGTLINNSIDSALGYASTELGPRWTHKRPVAISRRQTFLAKWGTAVLVVPILTAIVMAIAVGALGMYAPHVVLLWIMGMLAALMIATGTLALLAVFGSIGQLLAMLLLIYLSLASSGGTVPPQALPGVFNLVGKVEPLRQVLGGTRAILYFDAKGSAGLTHSLIVIACELLFWALVGLLVTGSYDRRKLDRISPAALAAVDRSIARGATEQAGADAV